MLCTAEKNNRFLTAKLVFLFHRLRFMNKYTLEKLLFSFSRLYLRKLFYSFYYMIHTNDMHALETNSTKRTFNLRTGVVGTNVKKGTGNE